MRFASNNINLTGNSGGGGGHKNRFDHLPTIWREKRKLVLSVAGGAKNNNNKDNATKIALKATTKTILPYINLWYVHYTFQTSFGFIFKFFGFYFALKILWRHFEFIEWFLVIRKENSDIWWLFWNTVSKVLGRLIVIFIFLIPHLYGVLNWSKKCLNTQIYIK